MGSHMKRFIPWIILVLLFCLCIPVISGTNGSLTTTRHAITIEDAQQGLSVTEDIHLENTGDENISLVQFWIQQGAQEVTILDVENNIELIYVTTGNVYTGNLTQLNTSLNPGESADFRVSYLLDTNTDFFEKRATYTTTFLSISFNQDELYRGEYLATDTLTTLRLYQPTEAPLSTFYIFLVLLLVVILVISTLLLLRKQRTKVKREAGVDSEELLLTKKALLLTLLKDLEKQHRSKSISTETYTKLKELYKQEAVQAMKKLDDLKK